MNTFDSPLKTQADAKSYFQAMGCSHFHMSREIPERYREYNALNISGETEIEWKKESLKETADSIENVATKDIWCVHSRMEDLVQGLKSVEALEIIYRFTQRIEEMLTPTGKMLVAETINGRQDIKYEPGLIFLADKLKRKDIAQEFCGMAERFASDASRKLSKESERCENAIEQTRKIAKILKLKTPKV